MSASNPYRSVGRPASGERFIDRPELTRKITAVWQEPGRPGNLSVFGHRRVGKTSLVEHALSQADRADLGIVRLNVGQQTSVFDLFRSVTRKVTTCFAHVAELVPLFQVVRDAREWYDLDNAVTAFFLEVSQHGLYVLVVLDEFDRAPRVLTDLSGFQLLRSLASEPRYPVGLVTISRRPIIEIETDAAGGSLLDGVLSERCYVGLFSSVEAAQMMNRARLAGVELGAVGSELLARSGSHPYLLELLCNRVVQHYQDTGVIDVAAAYEQEASAFRAYFGRLVQAIDLDTAGRGADLLTSIATRTSITAPSLDLQQLIGMGIVIRNGDDLSLFSPEFARYVLDPVGSPVVRSAAPAYRCTALVVATEWSSAHGGLSTFNRQLCMALAEQRVQVLCVVLDATDDEISKAKVAGVTLLRRQPVAGAPELSQLMRRPELADDVVPNLVIGHGRITGPAALMQAEDHFPGAKKLHFVHMAPDEIEWHKLDREDDEAESAESRTRIEVALGRDADRLVAVGPRLYGRFLGYLSNHDDREPLRFDPGFDLTDPHPRKVPSGTPTTVLLMGRVEDAPLKGVDLAAKACGLVAGWRHDENLHSIELVVRGVPEGGSAKQLRQLQKWAANSRLHIVPRTYTTDAERLADDLRRASLLVMPSRAEGFGLVGLEAIVAGTPVLVSEKSGLGELLRNRLGNERAGQCVVPMSGNTAQDTKTWARSIDRMLRGCDKEFAQAEALRGELAEALPWSRSADALLTALGF